MIRNTKYFKKCIALAVCTALLAAGCTKETETGGEPAEQENTAADEGSGQEAAKAEEGAGSGEDLAVELKSKYEVGAVDYSGDTVSVNRNEALQIKLGFDPWNNDSINLSESFVVYQDSQLKYPLEVSSYDWNEETGMLSITPPVYGPAEVDSVEMDLSHLSGNYLGTDDEPGWGNLSQLYLSTNLDIETGSPISGNPLVTVVKVNAELTQAPQVKFSQDDNGAARFTWKEVPGAEEYLIFSINNYGGALENYMNVFSSTKGTEWVAEQNMSYDGTETVMMNDIFSQYLLSEDYRGEIEEDDYVTPDYEQYFGVIAVNATGSSHISNLFNGKDLAHMLPNRIAYNSNEETIGASSKGTQNLPSTMGIIMCDGSVAQKVIDYDTENIEKNADNPYYTVKGRAYGTAFVSEFVVTEPDWNTLDQDLKAIVERQEKLKNKGGNVETDISIINEENSEENTVDTENVPDTQEPEEAEVPNEPQEEASEENKSPDTEKPQEEEAESGEENETEANENYDGITSNITANSALSEYLAMQMLNTNKAIDVSTFPEAADTELVIDAFLEAQYQNPLILGIKEAGMDTANSILYINYDYDTETTNAKRKDIEEKVAQITSEIITDGMSELDKELAINEYLCENAEYDNAALDNATENDFLYVDEIYNDSFTAYGVLVNGVGVCASYSAGFKLLADAAGLDSIVVTGYLEGSLPHAWNKVKIDEQWNIVDSTNNDNDIIKNALFNLSDDAAYAALVEDNRFALDTSLYDYGALTDDKEYYHIMDNYFGLDEVGNELAAKLKEEGSAVLRTEYSLDDETFSTIAQNAADASQADISGFYWMGVIHLEQQ